MTSLYWPYWLAHYYSVLEVATIVVGLIILVSSIDDLFIDIWYWSRRLYRKFTAERRYRPLTAEQLIARDEQPLAIMVPAWLEYDVIAPMIENMVSTLDYQNYVVFVGTYINDQRTIDEVERMRRRYKQLHRVEVPHAGPTCKADCLNWVIQAIFLYEKTHSVQFAGTILHDSEDVLHPLELRLFNYLLPRKDMIQLPVVSLERNWYEWVAGTYMDEFAEWHGKDLVVRESMTDTVPSAGVGTCFSRRALMVLADENQNQPFNTESLTEDYDVGARLAKYGMQAIFVRFPVQFRVLRKSWFRKPYESTLEMPLCVREFFPDTFRTAFRQKARWTLGIGLQGWEQMGWTGSLANRYLLFRDRKGVVTSFVSILAYAILIQLLALIVLRSSGVWNTSFPTPFETTGLIQYLLVANGIALLWRILHRCYFTTVLYGWQHGLLSIPRMVVGNFVNFMAAARAWRMFLVGKVLNRKLVWDKTMHDFPSSDLIAVAPRRLGSVLLSWQAINDEKLQTALAEQQTRQVPLGRILLSHGWLDDETLAEAIAFQNDLPRVFDIASKRADSRVLADEFCLRWRVVPLQMNALGRQEIAVASPLPPDGLQQITQQLGAEPVQLIARESDIVAQLRQLQVVEGQPLPARAPLLGDLLIEQGLLDRDVFQKAMLGYRPHVHGRIGDYLVDIGVLPRETIEQAVARQHNHYRSDDQTEQPL
ncbi:glycosyl transferase family protein [Pseudomonas syringae]|uniref:Bacteriophage N4 adsorption protein B n=1 Tax=Pseudomonas syringae pv. aptata TaxID=83167 RepID=A0A0N8T8X7_PSEAP|nr:glycosyl transferase family protein [Pseudomonas syringae]KFF85218.1 bacteriophage N4 adsorption protein B [Pseudomonas syringae pv. syringae]KMY02708.1 bacteriophage N4 adsorption protein B [Pseudomonas syringae KCTC 12500]KPY73546.1 Bacteriophage N4 adsorption protein B [Pseudomonas syringae pv. syringae]KPZ00825.1 Bacteriophage N4 adsorption protein B [Pseudomonas syringae pv. aptata]MBI6721361.1 glycosyl transferase family protein [Pseudomonas syringae]